jgi:hypothetical protein
LIAASSPRPATIPVLGQHSTVAGVSARGQQISRRLKATVIDTAWPADTQM